MFLSKKQALKQIILATITLKYGKLTETLLPCTGYFDANIGKKALTTKHLTQNSIKIQSGMSDLR